MTKAMRWGFSAVIAIGCCGLGSVVGCSDDEEQPPVDGDTGTLPVDTGTPVDTGKIDPDTGPPPGDSGSDTKMDAPPFTPDRGITVVFASPDFGNKFICIGGFTPGDVSMQAAPVEALGPPIGKPDSTAPCDATKYTGLPYGAVVPLPLSDRAQAFLDSALQGALYLVDNNTKDCKAAWADVKGDPSRYVVVPGKTILKGDHALVRIHGCKDPATTGVAAPGACGSAAAPAPLKVDYVKLDPATPATFAGGTTGPKVGLQFVHMSAFPGIMGAVPPFQNVDIYVQPMTAAGGGDAGPDGGDGGAPPAPAGLPTKIASGVSYKDAAAKAVGVQVAGDPNEAFLVITQKDVAPCAPGTTGCTSIWLPFKPFLAGYKPTGGGFVDGSNQIVGLSGSPVPNATTMMRSVLVPLGRINPPFPKSSCP